jgi:hypothetical protein
MYRAEPGYRTVARWFDVEDAPALAHLERLDRWPGSPWVRRLDRVRIE